MSMQEKNKKTTSTASIKTQTRTRKPTAEKTADDKELVMTIPESVEPNTVPMSETAATKKPRKSASRIITKNGEIDTPVADSVSAVIDSSVFDDDVTEEPIAGYYHKSMTIDSAMLSLSLIHI